MVWAKSYHPLLLSWNEAVLTCLQGVGVVVIWEGTGDGLASGKIEGMELIETGLCVSMWERINISRQQSELICFYDYEDDNPKFNLFIHIIYKGEVNPATVSPCHEVITLTKSDIGNASVK
ncbi:hypothetical protein DPMN_018593 [Dreissena polymorpha]|uniref:Uncharacterized protein n=1 Tax=Dreissena polymorpha TaxID=45954 RepID=A0A9D4S7F5_DREPO|nr:hypothetical protein DPMN_018593 [Dreissena polymorpha]